MADWKQEAERLKFECGYSWTEVYSEMRPYFPELSDKQVEEKVRGALRRSKKYHQAPVPRTSKDHFSYAFDHDVHLYIISDVHIGAHGFQRKEFECYIAEIEADELAKVIVLGDLIDNATLGSKGCTFSQKMMPQKQIETVIELLYPIKDKILFLCCGNHCERTFRQTGSDPLYPICLGLDCLDKYNYVHGYITITVKGKKYKLYCTHNIGRAESKLKKMCLSHPDCDAVIGGHIHDAKVVSSAQQLHSGKIRTSYAVTGKAWLKDESYAISAAYEPVSDKQPMLIFGDELKILQ